MSKRKIPAKFAPILNMVANYQRRSPLFGGTGTGGYNYADTKHDKSWKDYGYPYQIDFFMHWNMFRRNGYAFAGATIPVEMCWLTRPWVQQNNREDDDKETAYELAFKEMAQRLNLWKVFRDADLMQRIGRYSGLMWVIADGLTPDQPVKGSMSINKVVGVKPFYEGQLEPSEWEQNRASPRYGLPTRYMLNEGGTGNRDPYAQSTGTVHHSRITILTEDALGSDIYGIPCNEPGFNALLNLQKIQGAGGEGFWRQAAQRFVLEASGDTTEQEFNPEELTALSEMISEMFAGLDKIPAIGNYKIVPLNTTISNPKEFLEANLSEYSASLKGIPRKLISGTQTGVKAADEDTQGFMRLMQSRRENPLTEMGQRIIDWIATYTTLRPPQGGACLKWDDLTAPTQMDRLDLSLKMIMINKEAIFASQPAPFHISEIRAEAGYDAVDQLGDWDDGVTLPEDMEDQDLEDEEAA
jgi:hypothetical protein